METKLDRVASLASLSAEYQTSVTLFTCPTTGTWVPMLEANPRRWAVRFRNGGPPAVNQWWLPGSPVNGLVPPGTFNEPEEYHRRDWPAAVAGEWYYFGSAGDIVVIIQDIYLRG